MSKRRIAAFAAAVMMISGMGYSGASTAFSPMGNVAIEAEAASKTTKDFVTRMYKIVLGRNPDTAGLNKWVSQLNKKQKTAADLINGFFYSDEYKNKKKTANAMIKDCYKAMLNRNPDSKGLADWKKRFDAGMTIQAVCKGFVGSTEFKNLCAEYGITPGNITLMNARDDNYERTMFVRRLYENCLGRDADIAGLENWCMKIRKGTTGTQVAQGFVFSSEHMTPLNKLVGTKFINTYISDLYCSFLGRNPDSAGLKAWTEKLRDDNSLQYVFNGLAMSDEFKQQCAKAGIKVGSKIADPGDINGDAFMNKLLTLINNERAKNGVKALVVKPGAETYAKQYVAHLADSSKKYPSTKELYESCGLNAARAKGTTVRLICNRKAAFSEYATGEKYAVTTPELVFEELMDTSDGGRLRKALLSADYKYVGKAPYFFEGAWKYLDPFFVLVG